MLAVLFAAGLLLAGGAAIYFVSTVSVHTDPGAILRRLGVEGEQTLLVDSTEDGAIWSQEGVRRRRFDFPPRRVIVGLLVRLGW